MPAAADASGPRDRDDSGRARNGRPRDALGRPLPRGAAGGVARQPEGLSRTAEETIDEAQRLLDHNLPFHAHEVFEDAWKAEPAQQRELWRGLAQLAVGITHSARGNKSGADALLRRGAENLQPYVDSAPHGLDVAGLVRWASVAAEAARGGDDVPVMPPLRNRLNRSEHQE